MHVAIIGTGLMGHSVAERLLETGHQVAAYNRTRGKAERLRSVGAIVASTPEEAIRSAACTLLLLADAQAIREVLRRPGVKRQLRKRTVIQMGTIGPRESQAMLKQVKAAGGDYLEAPVLGSKTEARNGSLLIMVGSTPSQFNRWAGLLRCLGASPGPRRIGSVGKAAALKLALNHLIAAEISALALSVGLVHREGVSVDAFMAILRESSLYAPSFDKKLPRFLKRDFANPNFSTRHLLKDVRLFLQEAEYRKLDTSSLRGLPRLLRKTITKGWGEDDYSALYNAVNPKR